ncbi:Photosystem I assembly protein Ycf3 [Durusdinium trenchii]|uniref:Photosystem I assembly protein Ycf3 n=1 Tax=Durusdinium trenchii TaxID=1381693 RepID=A0ABP0MS52_9DINO
MRCLGLFLGVVILCRLGRTFLSSTQRFHRTRIPLRAEEDGILDGTFKEVASTLIGASPLPGVEKEAHEAYQEGLNAQTSGDLATAVRSYAQALRLESDPYDRSYILYNLGLCFAENGEYTKAAKYYMMAIDQNYELCSAWNNLGVIFHVQGMKAEQDYRSERAEALFAKAAQYWNRAASCSPGTYMDAEQWLLRTGRAQGDWKLGLDDRLSYRRAKLTGRFTVMARWPDTAVTDPRPSNGFWARSGDREDRVSRGRVVAVAAVQDVWGRVDIVTHAKASDPWEWNRRVNDTAVIVRRQATKILSAFVPWRREDMEGGWRMASSIMAASVLNHPDHPDVIPVTLDLLRRSTDSDALRNLVMGTFELLWFMDDEPTPEVRRREDAEVSAENGRSGAERSPSAAKQLSRVVDASRAMVRAPATMEEKVSRSTLGDILNELLRRFRKTIGRWASHRVGNRGSRKNSKGYEFAIRRWTTLILNEFVQLRRFAHKFGARETGGEGGRESLCPSQAPWEQWHMRRSLLSTLEAFATAQPKDLLVHLRPLTIYLALEDTSTPEEQWVAIKVCRILSSVLPYVAERRGLMDHRQVQADLQALIRSQPSSGVHEAVRCLCLVVKYVTGDLPQIVTHLNVAVPSLSKLCSIAEQKPGSLDRIQIMYMSRQAWVLSSILETLSVDDYARSPEIAHGAHGANGLASDIGDVPSVSDISLRNGCESYGTQSPFHTLIRQRPKRRLLPRSELKFDFVGNSVAGTVADLLLRLNELGEPQLRAVAASCMGFFLKGQRTYTKDPRISELLSGALSSGDLLLCRRALETLSTLLGFFRNEMRSALDTDTPARRWKTCDAGDAGDGGQVTTPRGRVLGHTDGKASKTNSAIEAAQPLAAFSDQVLAHITLAGSVGPAALKPKKPPKRSRSGEHEERDGFTLEDLEAQRAESVLRVRVEALAVARHLHQQGLVNPMTVLPKASRNPHAAAFRNVFALAFASEWRLSEPATTMLKEMLELRPQLLLNRLEESFRESFIALLSAPLHLQPHLQVLGTQQLAGLGEVYAERFRKQKALRDGFLRKALQQLQKVPTGQCEEDDGDGWIDRFAELAALGVGAPGRRRAEASHSERKESVAAAQQLPLRQRQQLLYSQRLGVQTAAWSGKEKQTGDRFIAGAISCSVGVPGGVPGAAGTCGIASLLGSLPFNFESEPLLLIYECNHHISLHAGTLLASFEGENTPKDPPQPVSQLQVFLSALSVVTSVVLKSVMKREYNLSAEQCATFNPRDIRQERIGRSMAMFQRDKDRGSRSGEGKGPRRWENRNWKGH